MVEVAREGVRIQGPSTGTPWLPRRTRVVQRRARRTTVSWFAGRCVLLALAPAPRPARCEKLRPLAGREKKTSAVSVSCAAAAARSLLFPLLCIRTQFDHCHRHHHRRRWTPFFSSMAYAFLPFQSKVVLRGIRHKIVDQIKKKKDSFPEDDVHQRLKEVCSCVAVAPSVCRSVGLSVG